MPITDIKVIRGQAPKKAPLGYTKIQNDLNDGAGGDYVFLCYQENGKDSPITDIVVVGHEEEEKAKKLTPSGYTRIDVDCNANAGGDYIYICFSRRADGRPVTALQVVQGDTDDLDAPPDFVKCSKDLNDGAGGDYMYLCYSHARTT